MIEIVRPDASKVDGIAEIVLNRPERRNALTPEMLRDLTSAVEDLEADAGAVLLRGEGRAFCAGFDLALCAHDSAALRELLIGLSNAIRTLRQSARPVVVAAHGAAIAGGCALLCGADLIVTDAKAKLGYPVVALGISPAVTAPLLRAQIGVRATRERLLDPATIDGAEAARIGLADVCVERSGDVLWRAREEAAMLASKPAWAFAATKRWLNEIEGSSGDTPLDRALQASLELVGSEEERDRLARMFRE